jgi:NAD(P)-dependent dehydrogenase (short-subunit alcohol dehydrogenase family)
MAREFEGQKLIVVGGTSGIGKAVAKIVLQNGGTAVIVGRRPDKTKAAIAELTPCGPVFGETADISKTAERAPLVERIDAQHRDATMLLNAAGVFAPKPFLEHTEADYDRYLEISKAIFFITQRVAKNLVDRKKSGSIVNIGSMWAKQAVQATPSFRLFDGKSRAAFTDAASRHGTRGRRDSSERGIARGRPDSNL